MNPAIRLLAGGALLAVIFGGGWFLLQLSPIGFTLFVIGPIFMGGAGAWMLRADVPSDGAWLGVLTILLANVLVIAFRIDGMVCVVMALPLTLSLGALGGYLAAAGEKSRWAGRRATMLLLLPPMAFSWDVSATAPLYEVRTAIDVAASPQQVWKHVVSFSDLPEARPWYFHTGIAYPLRARIEGSGPGAIRYCEFSTGPFVEPVEVWEEPRLLRFAVVENPPPLEEWNPFGPTHPKHLDGFLASQRGQFRLAALPNGRTRLEGTTWYRHRLYPAFYWRLWSDAIIHRIHLRVLEHVRGLAEQGR